MDPLLPLGQQVYHPAWRPLVRLLDLGNWRGELEEENQMLQKSPSVEA